MNCSVSWRRMITIVAVIVATVFGVQLTSPSSASASDTRCAKWGLIKVPLIDRMTATGQYCFSVKGSGLRINSTRGSLNTGWIYSPQEVVTFKDNHGNIYAKYYTYNKHNRWVTGGYHAWIPNLQGNTSPGTVCGTLLSAGTELATACVTIKP